MNPDNNSPQNIDYSFITNQGSEIQTPGSRHNNKKFAISVISLSVVAMLLVGLLLFSGTQPQLNNEVTKEEGIKTVQSFLELAKTDGSAAYRSLSDSAQTRLSEEDFASQISGPIAAAVDVGKCEFSMVGNGGSVITIQATCPITGDSYISKFNYVVAETEGGLKIVDYSIDGVSRG